MAATRAIHCPNPSRPPVVGRRIRVQTATLARRVVTPCFRCPPSARRAPLLARVFHILRALFAGCRSFLSLEFVLRERLYQQPPPAALALD
eukprot:2498116-Pyramimonas_sp.AAC.1